jgi:hypothetical protein
MKRHAIALSAALLVVSALVVGLTAFRSPVDGAVRAAAPAAPAFAHLTRPAALRWKPGHRYVYALQMSGEQTLDSTLLAGASSGNSALAYTGRWIVRPTVSASGALWLAVTFAEVEHAGLTVLGEAELSQTDAVRSQLEGQLAWIELDSRGAFVGVPPEATHLAQHFASYLARELRLELPPEGAERAEIVEDAEVGRVSGRVEFLGERDSGFAFRRVRDGLMQMRVFGGEPAPGGSNTLQSQLDALLQRDGTLQQLESRETVKVVEASGKALFAGASTLGLRLLAVELDPAHASLQAPARSQALGVVAVSAAADRRALEQRVGAHDMEAVRKGLSAFVGNAEGPVFRKWLWQTVGLLKLRPELCAELVAIVTQEESGAAARALTADLLAAAGHSHAQAALRQLLISAAAKRDGEAAATMMHQRLAFVAFPDADTAQYAEAVWKDAAGSLQKAAAQTLGSVASGVALRGDRQEASRLVGALAAQLTESADPELRASLIRGLGNAGAVSPEEEIATWSHDDAVSVRLAVASALRNPQSDEAKATLVELVADASAAVAGEALRSLGPAALSAVQVEAVTEALEAGLVSPTQLLHVISFVETHVQRPEARAAIAEAYLHSPAASPEVRARLASWL